MSGVKYPEIINYNLDLKIRTNSKEENCGIDRPPIVNSQLKK